ncbi:hypothetical protein FGO68_gene8591 [Halteria grandinella]|uniref:Uncharacterized protein n=1 Tax=Halteria grandinella TaxID=5974 RepID=A0A8J8NK79_HALGN|nr:hypothetical protein FGO68_gene8591 [Halteria grandinella]
MTLANILADDNIPICSCGTDKVVFYCSKSCKGQLTACITCWEKDHSRCTAVRLQTEVKKYADKWSELGQKIETAYTKLRQHVTEWGADLIQFAEKRIEPDNATNTYRKRIISTTRERFEMELMASLRLEFFGDQREIFFNSINDPNRVAADEDPNAVYCEKNILILEIGQPPVKSDIEDFIRRYDIQSLIAQDMYFQWYEQTFTALVRTIRGLTSIIITYPELFSFSFTQEDLKVLSDKSLDRFLQIRSNYIEQLQRAGRNQVSSELMEMHFHLRKIDQEITRRYSQKQAEIVCNLQNEIRRLQDLIGGQAR